MDSPSSKALQYLFFINAFPFQNMNFSMKFYKERPGRGLPGLYQFQKLRPVPATGRQTY
jgi:hypothetical protein